MHICVSTGTNIASDDRLLPWYQAIISTNAAILSIIAYGTYFKDISFKVQKISLKNALENGNRFLSPSMCQWSSNILLKIWLGAGQGENVYVVMVNIGKIMPKCIFIPEKLQTFSRFDP